LELRLVLEIHLRIVGTYLVFKVMRLDGQE
jgi:hypothetical protein